MKLKELIEAVEDFNGEECNLYLGFVGQKLESIILSIHKDSETAIDCDRYIQVKESYPAKTNLKQWLDSLKKGERQASK